MSPAYSCAPAMRRFSNGCLNWMAHGNHFKTSGIPRQHVYAWRNCTRPCRQGAEDVALRSAYALLDQQWTESSLEECLEAVVEVARKRSLSSLSDAKALLLSAVTVAQRSCAQAGELQCAAFDTIARALFDIGAYAEAVEWARRVYTDYRTFCGDDDIRTHAATVQLGNALYKTSAYEEAERVFQSILVPLPHGSATLPTAAALAAEEGLARVQLAQGKLAEAGAEHC